jgi:hypothetical protein
MRTRYNRTWNGIWSFRGMGVYGVSMGFEIFFSRTGVIRRTWTWWTGKAWKGTE